MLLTIGGIILISAPAGPACTIFVAARDGMVLAGNNEDNDAAFNPDTRIWFLPPEKERYGIAYVGYADGVPQGGMNDQGLFFDGAALPNGSQCLLGDKSGKTAIVELTRDKAHSFTKEEGIQLIDEMMSRSAGVEKALGVMERRFKEKGVRFNVVRGMGDFQVATNFQQSITPPQKVVCDRYIAATKMLADGQSLTVDLFRSILRATHQEGKLRTFYSNICDLKNGFIYLYDRGNYDKVVELNLNNELKKGKREIKMVELFK